MKQTNNAIKFLMAQYRAIFKNANIAMVAAMAAAALAAGSANAASGPGASQQQTANITDWTQIPSDTIDGTKGKALAIVAAEGKTESNGFDLTITSGSHTIKCAAGQSGQSGHHTLTTANGKTTTITLSGDGTAVAQPTLTIGGNQSGEHVDVTITNLNNYAGTLSIVGSGAASSLTATNIQIGGSAPAAGGTTKAPAAAESKAVVSLGASGEIIAAEGGTFNILSGGELKFAGAASKATANSGIVLNGGKISVADSGAGTVAGALTVTDGAVEVNGGGKTQNTLTFENLVTFNGGKLDVLSGSASGGKAILNKGLTMNSGTLTVKGGDNTNKSGKLEVSGDVAFNSNSKLVVETSGAATFGGNATFASGTVTNSGTIEALAGATINTDGTAGLYSANGKLKLTGATLNFTGAALDLSAAATNISGDASSTILALADKAAVTVDKSFNKKANNVTASTIVAKTENFPESGNGSLNIVDKNNILLISGGSVKALKELKGDKANSQIVVFNKQSGGSATLTLGKDASSVGKLTNISRVYVGLEAAKAGQEPPNFLNVNGKWDFNLAKLAVGTGATLHIEHGAEVNNVYWLQMHGYTDKAAANIDGTLNVARLVGSEKNTDNDTSIKGTINVTGTLNVFGDGKDKDASTTKPGEFVNDVQLAYTKLNINAGGTVALKTKDAWDDVLKVNTDSGTGITTFEVVASGGKTTDFGGWSKDNVKINAGGTLRIDLSGYKVADQAALDTLVGALQSSGSKGLIDFGGVSLGKLETNADGSINLDKMPSVKTEATQNLEVNLGNTTTLDKSYSMGSANVSGNSLTIGTGSTVEFNNAKNGQFATNTAASGGSSSKVNVTLAQDSALNLNGHGSLGDIKKSGSVSGTTVVLGGENGTQTVGVVDVATFKQVGGNVTTSGPITATTEINVKGVLNAGGHISTAALDLTSGGAINAAGKDITVSGTSADIFGDVEAGTLSLAGGATIAGNADVKLGTLNLADSQFLNVGRDGEDGSTATVFTDKLVMGSGSTIFVDPSYNDPATVLATKVLTDTTASDVNVSNGTIMVGKNAAFGIGFDQAEFESVMANYLVDGKFTDPVNNQGYANAFVLNTSLNIKSGAGVSVKHDLNDADTVADNSFTLGGRAALIITDKAFGTNKQGTAITFGDSTTGVANATVTADT